MRITIYDIARHAGVSIATVSHVLNDTGRVGTKTRQNVLRTIRELGYERDPLASALAGKNSYSIGFLVPDVNNAYFSEVLRGAEDTAFRHGYSVLICNTDHQPEKEMAYLKILHSKRMDGIIIATGSTPADVIGNLMDDEVRIAILSREIPNVPVGRVMVDNYLGGRLAANHLLTLGHRSIGYISEPLNIASSRERLKGFKDVVSRDPSVRLFISDDCGYGIEAGNRIARNLLEKHDVTALFAANDQLAVGALQACKQIGKLVPEDISLVGFDNTVLAQIVQPTLTTVAQPIYDLGQRAVSLTIESIESGKQSTNTVVLKPELVIRESTRSIW